VAGPWRYAPPSNSGITRAGLDAGQAHVEALVADGETLVVEAERRSTVAWENRECGRVLDDVIRESIVSRKRSRGRVPPPASTW